MQAQCVLPKSISNGKTAALKIHVTGLVQGVGFRPHIYRIALMNGIKGWVRNAADGVHIKALGDKRQLSSFLKSITDLAPPAADIFNLKIHPDSRNGEDAFIIIPSRDEESAITEISPDIAVCQECLSDMDRQWHRKDYPLVNCTNCGPRFTIIRGLPYDREKTSMAAFPMCAVCAAEYHEILDRRFHAQPVACNHCGPVYRIFSGSGKPMRGENIPGITASFIDEGNIIALKGTGGFHLICDATRPDVVDRLRNGKIREGKPFAVMFPSVEAIKTFAVVSRKEEQTLQSWQRPIVLLRAKGRLPASVSAGLPTLGAILPYMPFHYLLFRHLKTKAIIFTSANVSDEPVITGKTKAISGLRSTYGALVNYNRKIANRADDSVVQETSCGTQLIRRSRGFAPKPVRLNLNVDGIMATGSELKNCFCIGKGNLAIMSQHIGDLKNMETFSFFEEATRLAWRLFRFKPALIATDMHPDYMTTDWSRNTGMPVEYIQHHHAHIASCMAENHLRERVIGLSLDGTGYGTDGHIWGSEILRCDLQRFERIGHMEYIPLPGGDAAIKEPWRAALACLKHVYGDNIPPAAMKHLSAIDRNHLNVVSMALEKNINIALSSGIGRLFDAVSSMLGFCHYSAFEAEGPIRLEACMNKRVRDHYETSIVDGIVLLKPIIEGVVGDLKRGKSPGEISARFHNTLAEAFTGCVRQAVNPGRPEKLVLSGGSFQNRYLLDRLARNLLHEGLRVYTNKMVPVNDGGIALGQIAIAAERRNESCA
jgi:hydrogenase maturation protein HypF